MKGLKFKLPAGTVGFAIAAFGLTGVGGDEIVAYGYWCIEKGYARFTGPYENTVEWRKRAKGWIRVMNLDAVLSMVVYTLVTAAFYLLGSGNSLQKRRNSTGYGMIETLSKMYTDAYGSWAKGFFPVWFIRCTFFNTFFGSWQPGQGFSQIYSVN